MEKKDTLLLTIYQEFQKATPDMKKILAAQEQSCTQQLEALEKEGLIICSSGPEQPSVNVKKDVLSITPKGIEYAQKLFIQ